MESSDSVTDLMRGAEIQELESRESGNAGFIWGKHTELLA